MPISLPLPLGVRCPPRLGLAAPPLAVVTYESTREPKEASTKGIIMINVRARARARARAGGRRHIYCKTNRSVIECG